MTTIDTRKPQNNDIQFYLRDRLEMILVVTDQDDAAVDLSGNSLVFSIRKTENGTALETITTASGDIVIGGDDNNMLTFVKELSGIEERTYYYDLYNVTEKDTITDGKFIATYKGR